MDLEMGHGNGIDADRVSLEVYTLLGRQVATLLEGHYLPGLYRINYRADDLPAGSYLYKMKTREFQTVRLMNKI